MTVPCIGLVLAVAAATPTPAQLEDAITRGKLATVKNYLDGGGDPGAVIVEEARATALHMAVGHDRPAIVELLVKKGAPLEVRDGSGRTPLFLAAMLGHTKVVRALLKHRANPDAAAGHAVGIGPGPVEYLGGKTPLTVALAKRHATIAKLLIEAGADVHRMDDEEGFTPLVWAAGTNQVGVLQALLTKGARLEDRARSGKTAFVMAVDTGSEDAALFLRARAASTKLEITAETREFYESIAPELKNADLRKLVEQALAASPP